MLLEVLHLSGSEAGSDAVHPHVDHQLLVGIQQFGEGVERLLGYWVEADVNDLQLLEALQLVEELDGSVISDTALLKAELLKLVAEGGGGSDHLGAVVLD